MFARKALRDIILFLFGFIFCPLSFANQEITIPSSTIIISPDQTFSLRDVTEGLDYFLVDYHGKEPIENAKGIVVQKPSDVVFLTSVTAVEHAKKLAFVEVKEDTLIVHDFSNLDIQRMNYDSAHSEFVLKRGGGRSNFYAAPPRMT